MVVILDYGIGNVGSIYNMLKYIGSDCKISGEIDDIQKATKLILPGVGSFDYGMGLLKSKNFFDILNVRVLQEKVPILGICLGMQMMTNGSEEGSSDGLGWIEGSCKMFHFDATVKLKVPHMGWNNIISINDNKFFQPIDNEIKYYFAHSFYVSCKDNIVLATTSYGFEFPVAFKQDNILGVQFHPEKSHIFGMNFFKAFTEFIY